MRREKMHNGCTRIGTILRLNVSSGINKNSCDLHIKRCSRQSFQEWCTCDRRLLLVTFVQRWAHTLASIPIYHMLPLRILLLLLPLMPPQLRTPQRATLRGSGRRSAAFSPRTGAGHCSWPQQLAIAAGHCSWPLQLAIAACVGEPMHSTSDARAHATRHEPPPPPDHRPSPQRKAEVSSSASVRADLAAGAPGWTGLLSYYAAYSLIQQPATWL